MGETYPPAAAWGAQGASPLQPELLYICPGHFSSVTESSGHTIYTHLSHMLALWKVNVSQCSDARRDIEASEASTKCEYIACVWRLRVQMPAGRCLFTRRVTTTDLVFPRVRRGTIHRLQRGFAFGPRSTLVCHV